MKNIFLLIGIIYSLISVEAQPNNTQIGFSEILRILKSDDWEVARTFENYYFNNKGDFQCFKDSKCVKYSKGSGLNYIEFVLLYQEEGKLLHDIYIKTSSKKYYYELCNQIDNFKPEFIWKGEENGMYISNYNLCKDKTCYGVSKKRNKNTGVKTPYEFTIWRMTGKYAPTE